jgi:hypothetical protein
LRKMLKVSNNDELLSSLLKATGADKLKKIFDRGTHSLSLSDLKSLLKPRAKGNIKIASYL